MSYNRARCSTSVTLLVYGITRYYILRIYQCRANISTAAKLAERCFKLAHAVKFLQGIKKWGPGDLAVGAPSSGGLDDGTRAARTAVHIHALETANALSAYELTDTVLCLCPRPTAPLAHEYLDRRIIQQMISATQPRHIIFVAESPPLKTRPDRASGLSNNMYDINHPPRP